MIAPKGKGAPNQLPNMLSFKALATVFRELQAPELEAAQAEAAKLKEELAKVNARLKEAEKEIAAGNRCIKRQSDEEWVLKQKIWRLEHDNETLKKRAEGLWENVRKGIGENLELREKLYKRRKKDSTNAAA